MVDASIMATSHSWLLRVVLATLELATLFIACVWGFQQNAFAGLIAPLVVGMVWHRMIYPRLPSRIVVH
jgi:hypothetical protein